MASPPGRDPGLRSDSRPLHIPHLLLTFPSHPYSMVLTVAGLDYRWTGSPQPGLPYCSFIQLHLTPKSTPYKALWAGVGSLGVVPVLCYASRARKISFREAPATSNGHQCLSSPPQSQGIIVAFPGQGITSMKVPEPASWAPAATR